MLLSVILKNLVSENFARSQDVDFTLRKEEILEMQSRNKYNRMIR